MREAGTKTIIAQQRMSRTMFISDPWLQSRNNWLILALVSLPVNSFSCSAFEFYDEAKTRRVSGWLANS
jgi:hypothetical protein